MSDPISELNNPATPPERLAQIAQEHPELGQQIAAHPNVYPELQAWIAQYATPAPPVAQQPQAFEQPQPGFTPAGQPQAMTQPTTPLGFTGQQPTVQQPTMQQPDFAATAAFGPGGPGFPGQPGMQQANGQPPRKKRTGLIVGITAAVLVVLLAVGGGLWWLFGSKLGGSSSPEAAANKLVSSLTSMDPLSMYGSLAPSEFSVFEQATQTMLKTQVDDEDSKTGEQLIQDLKGALTIKTTTPVETETKDIVEGEVGRVAFTDGVIEIDGDPEKVVDAVMNFAVPIMEAQYGETMSKSDEKEARESMLSEIKDNLPYTIDFSRDFRDSYSEREYLTVVAVHENGGWYVSPLMTAADYAYQNSGFNDKYLGDEIVAPSKDGAQSPEDAATLLTETIFNGDYDSFVAQMPLTERRLLSVYGTGFIEASGQDTRDLKSFFNDSGITLDSATFKSEADGNSARVSIDDFSFSVTDDSSYAYFQEQAFSVAGVCLDWSGKGERSVDYYSYEYDDLWEEWLDDRKYTGGYLEWLEDNGYDETEKVDESWSACLDDKQSPVRNLAPEDWRIIAVKEDNAWKISPIGTAADISTIISNKIAEAMKQGKLESLFEA